MDWCSVGQICMITLLVITGIVLIAAFVAGLYGVYVSVRDHNPEAFFVCIAAVLLLLLVFVGSYAAYECEHLEKPSAEQVR